MITRPHPPHLMELSRMTKTARVVLAAGKDHVRVQPSDAEPALA
jgi:hypothetical protein